MKGKARTQTMLLASAAMGVLGVCLVSSVAAQGGMNSQAQVQGQGQGYNQNQNQAQYDALAKSFKTAFAWLGAGQAGLLFEPNVIGPKASIAIFAMHDNGDYLSSNPTNPCPQLAARGYRVLCSNSTASKAGFFSDDDTDKLLLNVKNGVAYLKKLPGVQKVIIFGHSGGGEMMAAYQNIAENGIAVCQGPEKIVKCANSLANMPAADGIMLIDAVPGGPVTTLWSLDPAVTDEDNGTVLDPDLDMYNPKNGFNPKGSTYSDEFKKRFFAAQGERMNKLIVKAQDRLAKIEAGKGRFTDDEPFVIPGAMGAQNKLNAQDITLQAQTRNAWPLLHPDGTATTEIIHSVRTPRSVESPTPRITAAIQTTVRRFLDTWAIRTLPDYGYNGDSMYGIDYASTYDDLPESIAGISKPILQMGMTGSFEFFGVETAREHAIKSNDKTLAYVEGATHGFTPCMGCATAKGKPADYFGDTVKTLFNYADGWLSKPGRFLPEGSK